MLLDLNPTTYADADSVVDVSGVMSSTIWTKTGTPTVASGALDYDGTGDYHSVAEVPFTDPTAGAAAAKTIYVVFELDTLANYRCPFAFLGSGAYLNVSGEQLYLATASTGIGTVWSFDWANGWQASNVNGGVVSFATGTVYVLSIELDGTNKSVRLDGGTAVSSLWACDMTGYSTILGGNVASTELDGKIHRVIVDDAAYSATLVSTLQALYA